MKKTFFAVAALITVLAAVNAPAEPVAADTARAAGASTDTAAVELKWESDVTVVESADAQTVVIIGAEPSDTQAVITFGTGKPEPDSVVTETVATETGSGEFVVITSAPGDLREEMMAAQELMWRAAPRFRLFSVRPEYQLVFGEIGTVGVRFEFGMIDDENGVFLTGDFGGGANYHGGGLNVGYRFATDALRYALGLSCGYHNTELVVDFKSETGRHLELMVGHNTALAGVFAKVMPWNSGNLDITTRVMFGYKKGSAWYDEAKEEIYLKKGFSAVWSLSVGYTLLERSER